MKKLSLLMTATLASATLVLAACNKNEPEQPETPPAPTAEAPAAEPAPEPMAESEAPAEMGEADMSVSAKATMAPTEGNTAAGLVTFTNTENGVHMSATITGLAPDSEHGFHIHEKGDCSAPDGTSAGGHFNPTGSDHGSMEADMHHAGDMPNLMANAEGSAMVDMDIPGIELGTGTDGGSACGRARPRTDG